MSLLYRNLALFFMSLAGFTALHAADPGKEEIGTLRVRAVYASHGEVSEAGIEAVPLDARTETELKRYETYRYAAYRVVGHDEQPIFRGYENWVSPLSPSKDVLLSFEPRQHSTESIQLDMAYWQGKRKIYKTDPVIKKGKPLFILGPEWRGGRLILVVEVVNLQP